MEYERKIYSILKKKFSNVNLTKAIQGDGGVDLILFHKDMLVVFQCKNLATKVGIGLVREFTTVLESHKVSKKLGIMVSANGYSGTCFNAIGEHNILLLMDTDNIQSYIISQYEKFEDDKNISNDNELNLNRFYLDIRVNIGIGYVICIIVVIYLIVT
ncbi:MAG TPA: DUF2034 domain-containing protein [Candidatus Nitrosocosmicus sp.]